MRLSSLMVSVALAGAALAGGAKAAVTTIAVSGTYTAGSNATLPATGPISGYLTFDLTPTYIGGVPRFGLLNGDIEFGSGANSVHFLPGTNINSNYEGQSGSQNLIQITDSKNDVLIFTFAQLSADTTKFYTFDHTPANFFIFPSPATNAFSSAIGGGFNPTGPVVYPTASITLNTAVPEPASWALMIGGFGLAGAALRRRNTQPLTA